MSEGKEEIGLKHTGGKLGDVYRRGLELSSRRQFLSKALKVVAGGAVGAAGLFGLAKAVEALKAGQTREQEMAQEFLKTASEDRILTGVEVIGEKVNLRDKPAVEIDTEPDSKAGEKEGYLKKGDKVDRAIVVFGRDPEDPYNNQNKGKWLAFEHNGKVVFASKDYFGSGDSRFSSMDPFDLKSPQK